MSMPGDTVLADPALDAGDAEAEEIERIARQAMQFIALMEDFLAPFEPDRAGDFGPHRSKIYTARQRATRNKFLNHVNAQLLALVLETHGLNTLADVLVNAAEHAKIVKAHERQTVHVELLDKLRAL